MLTKYAKMLGLESILERLAQKAVCKQSKNEIKELGSGTEYEEIKNQLELTDSATSLLLRYNKPELLPCDEFDSFFAKLERLGVLFPKELLCVVRLLHSVENLEAFGQNVAVQNKYLNSKFSQLKSLKKLRQEIEGAITLEEELSDDASFELKRIRTSMRSSAAMIREELANLKKLPENQKYLQESIVTIRNGRFALPVKAEYRTKISGLVQDTSASGATLFIEPMSVVEHNNKIRVLEAKEKKEEYRILEEFTHKIYEQIGILKENYGLIIFFDILFAKAQLALEMNAILPTLTKDGLIDLIGARHPLLNKDTVVPIDVKIGGEFSTLVVTGPNTGGKTVVLKTVGLLVLMAMHGLLVPVKEGSGISIFDKVLVDIGDEQSIEQNLSTFSGHITNLIKILELADNNSLILVDELGSGTDPVEGASLAIAILTELSKKGAKVIATTHYPELKIYALSTPKVQNACCEFDISTLKPNYRLITGLPGKSNAFAIAERLGLSHRIIEDAKNSLNENSIRFETMISELHEIKLREQAEAEKNIKLQKELIVEREKLEQIKTLLSQKEDERIAKFKAETEPLVRSVKKALDQVTEELNQIKKTNDIKKLEELRNKLKVDVSSQLEKFNKRPSATRSEDRVTLKKGDSVFVGSLGRDAIVTSNPSKNGMVSVKAGNIATRISICDLKKTKIKNNKQTRNVASRIEKKSSRELHLLGLTVSEAILELDKFIDNAHISGLNELVIVHGRGTGVLRAAVHEFLKSSSAVKSFRLGRYGEGEDGVTVVKL